MSHLHLAWPSILWLPASVPLIEKVVRSTLVYGFLLLAFRFSSKRELGQATLFDFLLILLVSNGVQSALIGPENSVAGAFVGTATLLFLAWLLNHTTTRSVRMRRLLEGSPALLVQDGVVLANSLRHENVALNDLYAGLRAAGVANLSQVGRAYLELDGRISVIPAGTPPELLGGSGCVLPDAT